MGFHIVGRRGNIDLRLLAELSPAGTLSERGGFLRCPWAEAPTYR